MQNDRKTVTIMKAREITGVSRRTIYNWMGRGHVEYIRTAGGNVRIYIDTLWRTPDDQCNNRKATDDDLISKLANKHSCSTEIAMTKAKRAAQILQLNFRRCLAMLIETHDRTVWTSQNDDSS